MEDKDKTKKQLVEELNKLRKRVTELEKSGSEHRWVEESLKKSIIEIQFLAKLLNDSSQPFAVGSPDGRLIRINPAYCQLTGYTEKELLEDISWNETLTPPEWREYEAEVLNTLLSTGKPQRFEKEYIHKDGTRIFVELLMHRKLDVDGNLENIYGFITDITERKRAEEEIKISEEKYHTLFEQAADSIVLIDGETGKLVEFNERAYENLGYTREEFERLTIPDFEVIESAEEVAKHINKIIRKGYDSFDTKHRRKDGEIRNIFVNSRAISLGGKDFVQSLWRDITENKQIENNLRISEEKYRSLIETTDDLVYLVKKNYSYIFMNKKHAERFKIPMEKIIGRPYSEFHSKKQTEIFEKDVNEVIRTGNSLSHEHESERDGNFYLRTYSPVKSEKGEVIAINVISKDISKLKGVENELKESEQVIHKFAEYLQTVREKERALVASELHDEIGQALTSLRMDIFMIKNKMSKDQKEIPSEFQRMENLLDDSIQKLRKIYSDLRPSLLEHFGIGEAIEQYVNDFQEQSGTKCTFYQDPEEIILDENRSIALYRILQGAINNIKWHSQATKVDIRLVEKGPNLKLTIRDNGRGIKEEQVNSGESFGLIGMRERARFLGGELDIKGIPDKGTTVKLEIPIKQKSN